jgi:hypothetical protein
MDSSLIRSLIFQCRVLSGTPQLTDVTNEIIDLATRKGVLDKNLSHDEKNLLTERIFEVIWGLVIEGVILPGTSSSNPTFPRLRLTEYGKQCCKAGELTPHDPDGYLNFLRKVCPSVDAVTLLYTGEALDTFRTGRNLASVVMIGVAAENMLLRLVDSVHGALDTPQRQAKFEKDTKGKIAKKQHDEVLARLRSPATPLPGEIEALLTQHVDGIYDLIRRTRNDAGHPTGKRMERYETHALLLLFPTYCKTVHDLMEWLGMNPI